MDNSHKEKRMSEQAKTKLKQAIKEYALKSLGADLIGVASATDPQFARAPKGHHPTDILPGAKSVIVMGIRQMKEVIDHASVAPSAIHFKHYDLMNVWLEQNSYQLAMKIKGMGFSSIFIPETDPYTKFYVEQATGAPRFSPIFCHIHAAVAAGLGKRGKVGVVLTPQFGPLQRWASVLTTAELAPDPKLKKEVCIDFIKPGSCNLCIDACLNGSLRAWPEEGGIQMYKCAAAGLKATRGNICANCIGACPLGK